MSFTTSNLAEDNCIIRLILFYRMNEADLDAMDSLVKENQILKQQLQNYFLKVAKTQKVTFPV